MSDASRQALATLTAASGDSLAALSRMIGRNPAYLQQFIARGSPRRLDERDRRLLANYLAVEESVLGGEAAVSSPAAVRIVRLDVAAAAGAGGVAEDRPAGDRLLDPSLLQRLNVRAEDVSIIRAMGDSMLPTIADGDELLVDRSDRRVRTRPAVFVVRGGDALMVKRVARAGLGLSVTSDNPAYGPVDAADIEIVGRVVWLSRALS